MSKIADFEVQGERAGFEGKNPRQAMGVGIPKAEKDAFMAGYLRGMKRKAMSIGRRPDVIQKR